MSVVKKAFFLAVASVFFNGGANATTLSHYAETTTFGAPAPFDSVRNPNGASASSSTSWSAPFIWGGTSTVQDATFSGNASANLNTGSLRAFSSVENREPTSGSVLPLGERSHLNESQAKFGDTFSIFRSDPNVGVSGGFATLTLGVHGFLDVPEGVDFETSFTEFGQTKAYNFYEHWAGLTVHEVGSFDLFQQILDLDPNDFASLDDYIAAASLLGDQRSDKEIAQEYVHKHSNQAVADELSELIDLGVGQAVPGEYDTSISITVPLSDGLTTFEWEAELFTRLQLDSSVLNAALSADFGNTAVLSVTLPEGYILTSGSGQFPQSNVRVAAVPEPATLALVGLGLAGLVGLTRRRRAA